MWSKEKNCTGNGFSTPPPTRSCRKYSPLSDRKHKTCKADLFHVVHKVPSGDSPYVRAKHVQLIEKDPSKAISLFWAAINSGDRVDSALKDMAVVMKQLDRSDEAIEAIKSFRYLCPPESQDSLDNVLVELYKRSGRIEEEIEMLELKLKHIDEGTAFGGRRTKIARSQGKKVQITIEQEKSRILGNLAWAYLQLKDYKAAERLYREALCLEPDKNKQCNLAICLMNTNRIAEAKSLLEAVKASSRNGPMDESYAKSFENSLEMLHEVESQSLPKPREAQIKTQGPFIEPTNRNSGFLVSRRTTNINVKQKESPCLSYFENKDKLSGYCKGDLSPMPCGTRARFGNYFEGRPDFSRNNCTTRMDGHTADRRLYTSPVSINASPVLLTQPRSPWWFSKGGRIRLWADGAVGNSSRKLSFDQPIDNGRAALAPSTDSSKDGDWRRQAWGALAKSEVFSKFIPQNTVNGDWKRSTQENFRCNDSSNKDTNFGPELFTESTKEVDNALRTEALIDRYGGTPRPKDAVENESLGSNNSGTPRAMPVSPKPTHRKKKSWADMVEEEEQKLFSEQIDLPDDICDHYQEPSFSGNQGFYDENQNCNISHPPAPSLMNQVETNCQMHELSVKDEIIESRNDVKLSKTLSVCRSLCFNQQKKSDPSDFCFSPAPTLSYEGDKSVQENERESSFGKYMTPMRRNRLQVFRDITHPDSSSP